MIINQTTDRFPFNILIISDTHLPRGGTLPEFLTGFFRDLEPDLILHCGDIYDLRLLSDLGSIAPVYAVRGNRDILMWFSLPPFIDLKVNGFRIHIEHGQGHIIEYSQKKLRIFWKRLRHKPWKYDKNTRVIPDFHSYDVCCAGHTHLLQIFQIDQTMIVNPGHLNLKTGTETDAPSFILMNLNKEHILFRQFIVRDDTITEGKTIKFEKDHGLAQEMQRK